jgi:acetyl esterase/lipase
MRSWFRVADVFHPDLRHVARWLPPAPVGPRTFRAIRMATWLLTRRSRKNCPVSTVGAISVRMHQPVPHEYRVPALLWIHGGGYVIGSAGQEDAVCRHFAETLGIVVAAVDYRLAPEHRFPEPLEDCHDALVWLARQPHVDPTRIAVGGASAGGGLAAALSLLAHERGEVPVAFQLLTYPMLDDRTATRTDLDESHFRLWNNEANRFGWQSYTGYPAGSVKVSGLAAPSRYDDLSGLPPAWIGVGSLDLFHDESIAYASRFREAGVECELNVVEGAFHGFDVIRPKAEVSIAFRTSQDAALAAALL